MIPLALAATLLASPAVSAAPAPAALSTAADAGRPITLDEAYAAALKRSEAIAEAGETYAEVMAQVDELWAEVKPRISLDANQTWQDTPGPNVNFPLPANTRTAAINGHQPLFSGLRDFLAVKAGRAQGEAAQFALQRAKELLYRDTADAYLNLLRSRRDIATHEAQVQLTAARVKELRNFE